MVKSFFYFLLVLSFIPFFADAQLKFLVEDFEGLKVNSSDLGQSGLFRYGNCMVSIAQQPAGNGVYSGNAALRVQKSGSETFGGWGKGITFYIDLEQATDFFNFYILHTQEAGSELRISLQEDDNEDSQFNKDLDDEWNALVKLPSGKAWQLVSVPLSAFKDVNPGGDGAFNVSHRSGKLLGLLFDFTEDKKVPKGHELLVDFLCFSKGILPHSNARVFDPLPANSSDFCSLAAWSYGEGKVASFVDIAKTFEKQFEAGDAKIDVVHFFQPFGKDDGSTSLYPSAERINKVIEAGYIPMITLENHFVSAGKRKQPNLYSILEGHFDSFFGYWCHLIKDVKGTVLLRILHEFNGDWYDWSTVKNDRNPELVARTFRYIHKIFEQNQVHNVRFIWCPNSMSLPQEKWNEITLAYPGDEYVDFVGLDVYNGAGANSDQWRSFRKEGIQNYYVLHEKYPDKPMLICESASRKRKGNESGETKAEWIKETAIALKTDMAAVRLYAWFNQGELFDLQNDKAAREAFYLNFIRDVYFSKNGKKIRELIR